MISAALVVLAHSAVGRAAGAQTPSPTVAAAAADADGRPLASAVTGEHWTVAGTVGAAPPGSTADVVVTRAGAVVDRSVVHVRPQTGGDGHFRTAERFVRPGTVRIDVAIRSPDGQPVAQAVPVRVRVHDEGRRRAGCRAAAIILTAGRRRRVAFADGVRARRDELVEPGARLVVRGRLLLSRGRVRYRAHAATLAVTCGSLRLLAGRVRVGTPSRGRYRARMDIGAMTAWSLRRSTVLAVSRSPVPRLAVRRGGVRVASLRFPRTRLRAIPGDVVLAGAAGSPRLSTWPFARSPDERAALVRDRLPRFWADGLACSVGCRPRGARTGWPLRPFHRQHPLRSGLNELRPANLHIGIDIQALDGTRVYAVQSGRASIAGAGTVDERVRVGSYLYWHVVPRVHRGQYVRAFRTVVGVILRGAGHLHFSELRGGAYLNPLRPGGSVLAPYRDAERPVIGAVRHAGATAFADVFDPQTLRVTLGYRTPVLAPAAVAWRPRDGRRRAIGPLRFAYRGSQHLPNSARSMYGPGTHRPDNPAAHEPGWGCFASWTICVPRWNYRLGLLPPGTRRVTVYAWDWAGNVSVRTSAV